MQNKATFDKAKALEAAGFPQPAPQVGQIWYTRHLGALCLVTRANETGPGWRVLDVQSGQVSSFTPEVLVRCLVYAPEATEILKELGEDWGLYVVIYTTMPCEWDCRKDPEVSYAFTSTNPADACADAHLFKAPARHASPA